MARGNTGGSGGVRYVIDTSSIIAGHPDGDYPMPTFKTLWEDIDSLIVVGAIISSVEVFNEPDRKDDELLAWAKDRRKMFWDSNEDVQRAVRKIVNEQRRLVSPSRPRSLADPFVVALALSEGAAVVTQERPGSASKPKIPDACSRHHLGCFRLAGLAKQEGWVL